MGSKAHKEKIWSFISEIGTGMLVTEDEGSLRARPMQLVQDDYDGTIYFFSRLGSHKTKEVIEDKNVCITFTNRDEGIFVSLTGVARISQDQSLIDSLWNEDVGRWFPEGRESDSCSLLEIKIHSGEHWEHETNDFVKLYQTAKAKVRNRTPNLGEHQKFGDM